MEIGEFFEDSKYSLLSALVLQRGVKEVCLRMCVRERKHKTNTHAASAFVSECLCLQNCIVHERMRTKCGA